MYNRYQGNTGRVVRVNEGGDKRSAPQTGAAQPMPRQNPAPGAFAPVRGTPQSGSGSQKQRPRGIMEQLGQLLPTGTGELETEDLILLLILYLMYRESGDSELLIIMGAMFLL